MKPVDMMVVHDPENGAWGDCTRACIASIFELPAHEVPHFAHDGLKEPEENGQLQWVNRLREWLNSKGYDFIYFEIPSADMHWNPECLNFHYLVSGKTHYGTDHHTVWYRGKMVHNPQPKDRGELVGYPFDYIIIVKK